jgi:predicted nucleic acid-binding protein
MPVVADASVCLGIAFQDERSEQALKLADVLRAEDGLVPPVWALEVANSLLSARRRERITDADLVEAQGVLLGLPLRTVDVSRSETFGAVSALARIYGLSSYDASYLHIALRERLPLATLDDRLRAAAEAARCTLFA